MAARRPADDEELVQIVDRSLADATVRGGGWLACRPGCAQCCHGVFAISALDAMRLRDGLAELGEADPERAARVLERAKASVGGYGGEFPGDPVTGVVGETDEEQERFAEFANEAACPALDPESGTCDLYAARPLTCRIFGPPVLSADGLGMCELCFVGASDAEIAAGEMYLTHAGLEDAVTRQAEDAGEPRGSTIVAYALLR
jgi:Fe-S-cluster containining protein